MTISRPNFFSYWAYIRKNAFIVRDRKTDIVVCKRHQRTYRIVKTVSSFWLVLLWMIFCSFAVSFDLFQNRYYNIALILLNVVLPHLFSALHSYRQTEFEEVVEQTPSVL